jgi:tetratricopeptide (TPR) repeat protein
MVIVAETLARSPSTSGYMIAAAAAAAALFFVLWWMLQAEESPWVPAGLAASVVMLVAALARLLVARRGRNPHRNFEHVSHQRAVRRPTLNEVMHSPSRHAAALRTLQKHSAVADERESANGHREVYELCAEYLTSVERVLDSPALQADGRVALRVGQERVRELQKHHLLICARQSARTLTHEAQQRVRLYEKVETANRALDCIDQALMAYPNDAELITSAQAVQEFITSSRVAHWVELGERAAFKGHYQRAIDCYRDALYYLGRDAAPSDTGEAAERILKEIDILRARISADAIKSGRVTEFRRQHRSNPDTI